jgi:hypothetical protein
VHTALRRTTEVCGPLNLPRFDTITNLTAVPALQMIMFYYNSGFIIASLGKWCGICVINSRDCLKNVVRSIAPYVLCINILLVCRYLCEYFSD